MKIKTKLMLSYLAVIIIILSAALFISIRGMKRLESRNLQAARAGIENVVKDNVSFTKETLIKVGEHLVVLRSKSVALEFKLFLEKNKRLRSASADGGYDYSLLRKSKEARAILSQKIFTPGSYRRVAGYVDLMDIHGEAVIHPNHEVEGENYSLWKKKFPDMWSLVNKSFTTDLVSGYYRFVDIQNHPVRKFMSLKRVTGTPFIISAVVEIDKYFMPVQKHIEKAGEAIKTVTDEKVAIASETTLDEVILRGFFTVVALLLLGALLALWQANSTSRPISELADKVRKIGRGDFSVQVPEEGSLEIKKLASSFNSLGDELHSYMENLKKEVATREAIESEIKVARHIQETLLPHSFPPFPERNEFDLFAALVPAKEMSGDFYDFFFVDETTLALIIADVSGKGVPAAIFMAVSRTLLRNLSLNSKGKSPAEILTAANSFLCMENDEAMFVTTFLAYYNINSGEMIYVNAGHNPFLSLKEPDNRVEECGLLSDIPLGIMEDYTYSNGEYVVSEGEKIIFYTDGVTEATAPDEEFYGTDRFYSILEKNAEQDIQTILEMLKDDVVEYQHEHQFDDITLMALKRVSTN